MTIDNVVCNGYSLKIAPKLALSNNFTLIENALNLLLIVGRGNKLNAVLLWKRH